MLDTHFSVDINVDEDADSAGACFNARELQLVNELSTRGSVSVAARPGPLGIGGRGAELLRVRLSKIAWVAGTGPFGPGLPADGLGCRRLAGCGS